MPKSSCFALVDLLASGLHDTVTADRFYREVVYELGQRHWLMEASLIQPVAGTPVYNYPETAVNIKHYFYDAQQLIETRLSELEWINPNWRDEKGSPYAVVRETETTRTFRVYPIPDVPPSTFAFAFGEDFGRGYPDGTLAVIHGETRDDLPAWLDLPVALETCAREFTRDSDHTDFAFAKVCHEFATVIFGIVQPSSVSPMFQPVPVSLVIAKP